MLTIKNLHVTVDDKPILRGIDLAVHAGEVHAIMGPTVRARARSRMCWPGARPMS